MPLMVLLMGLLIFPWMAHAATRFAVPSGGATTGDCTVSACTPQRSLDQAVAGDTVSWAPGAYSHSYAINVAGTSGAGRITLQSATLHGAVLTGTNNCTGSTFGLHVNQPWWIIHGFDLRQMCIGILIDADNTEVRHTLIYESSRWGIGGTGGSQNLGKQNLNIHHNVIGITYGDTNGNFDWSGIAYAGNNSTIQANWIYGAGHNRNLVGTAACCQHNGLGLVLYEVNGVMVQGNVFMDGTKTTGLRIFGQTDSGCISSPNPACRQSFNNTVRDNIIARGQGGGGGITENARDNLYTNNVHWSVFEYTGIGNKGNDPGRNVITHNTSIMTPQSQRGMSLECGAEVGNVCSVDTDLNNNLMYSPSATNAWLLQTQNYATSINTANHNLFWQPGSEANWTRGPYTFGANDLHASGSPPVFVSEATGNYQLAAGSPGKGSASDATDRGANFDTNLRLDWLQAIVQFLTVTKSVDGASSTSFGSSDGVDSSHYYQVWGYIQESSPFTGSFTYTAETVTWTTTMSIYMGFPWVQAAPFRWMYLATVKAADGTLNVSWDNNSTLDQVQIVELPTAPEAYAIMTQAGGGPPAAPTNLRVVSP
jgi:hypothetical protein